MGKSDERGKVRATRVAGEVVFDQSLSEGWARDGDSKIAQLGRTQPKPVRTAQN